MAEVNYSVKAVAQRTGLTTHVIRVWEKRYGAVQPNRTGSNRRRYTQEEVDRLALLRAVTQAGHAISQIASLDERQLRDLAQSAPVPAVPSEDAKETAEVFITRAVEGVRTLDAAGLENALVDAAAHFGTQGLLQKIVVPLAYRVGELWQSGEVTAAEEHFASSHLRSFLGSLARPYVMDPGAPLLLTGTPSGQHHEMGAMIVGVAASSLGWRVANLSSSLPAAEIASAAIKGSARAVALSLVYPQDDPKLPDELRSLRKMLPGEIDLMVGGRAATAYGDVLREIDARVCTSCDDFCAQLNDLRTVSGDN